MRIVLTWDEFKMMELFFIHMKENAHKQEKGTLRGENYEVTWNPQLILIELKATEYLEKMLIALEGLDEKSNGG